MAGSWDNNLGIIHPSYGAAITYPLILAFLFSLLQANWTYTGYDASAHVAEETVGARMASAWGVFLSVAVSAVVGYIFLLALVTHMPNLSTLFPADLSTTPTQAAYSQYYFGGGVAVISILEYNLDKLGDILAAAIAIAMWFCGLASVGAAGRMLFAFSRDDGIPGLALAQAGLAPLPDAGQRPDRRRGRVVAVHGRDVHRRDRHGDRDRHRHQHDLPVCRVRRRHLPRRPDRGMEGAPRLEPRPLVASRSPGSRSSGSSS